MLQAEFVLAPTGDARGATRRLVDFAGFVRESDAVALKVQVRDISTDGCRLWASEELTPQSEIWLKVAGLAPIRARVAWVASGEAGCEFSTPLHPSIVEQLLAPGRRIVKGAFGPTEAQRRAAGC